MLLRDADGEPVQYAGTLLDVSDRKDLESQLLHAHKMDAIGKLTGGIAHDFNNLLAAVLGGIGLIERRLPLEDEHKKILDMTCAPPSRAPSWSAACSPSPGASSCSRPRSTSPPFPPR